MSSREAFIAKVRSAQPAAVSREPLPYFPTQTTTPALDRFRRALELMGGQAVDLPPDQTLDAWITQRFGADIVSCSAVDSFTGTRILTEQTPPASLQDVDMGVVRARFGVAETGSVWFSEDEYRVNAIGYIVQHLVVLLDPAAILEGLQDAYRRDDFSRARYAALVTGPSATADIEGVMIRGAQGVRSLTVIFMPSPLSPVEPQPQGQASAN